MCIHKSVLLSICMVLKVLEVVINLGDSQQVARSKSKNETTGQVKMSLQET